jgi:glycosyltransferase involved in cell wall biosynthesis
VVPSGDDQTGLHVDGANTADIAWGLNEALSDRRRLATWGANGRARVRSHARSVLVADA